MESPILKQVEKFSQKQKKRKQWMVVFIVLAVIVVFGTVAALRMMGQAMTHREKVLNCQLQLHEHIDACYDEEGNLICGYADYVVHTHNDDCYNADGELVCTLPEVEKHEHTEDCYEEVKTLVCEQEETDGHQHTEECYTSQKGDLVCEETEHSHSEECYDEEGNLICGMEEHQHEDDCYEWEDVLTCKLKESESGHKHTEDCYEVQEVLICDQLELHTHTEECFEKIDENGGDEPENLKLICGKIQLEEHVHTEEAGCFEIVEVADEEIAQTPEAKEETDETSQGGQEIITADTSSDTAENEAEEYDETKTYEGSGYIVTVSYNKDANIPEEAEFIAEQITEESDEENYKQHEAEFKKSMEDEDAVMSALFKIGFYVDGEEVEPESPVAIAIQFVDENGLPEGVPVKIVHFADGENEVIDGGMAESGSTSFKTNGFSNFAVGFSKADADSAPIHISESYEYDNAAFHITFHVEGDAKKLEEEKQGNSEADIERRETLLPESDNGTAEEKKLEFELAFLDKDSEEYQAVVDNAKETNNGGELLFAQAISYSMSYDGEELDLSECKITAEVEAAKPLSRRIKKSVPDAIDYLRTSGTLSEESDAKAEEESDAKSEEESDVKPEEESDANPEEESDVNSKAESDVKSEDESQTEISIEVVQIDDKEVTKLDGQILSQKNTNETMSVAVPQTFAAVYSSQSNPKFTVQYYAYLDRIDWGGGVDQSIKGTVINTSSQPNIWDAYKKSITDNKLPIIDTSGGNLPINGIVPEVNSVLIEDGKIKTIRELTEVYAEREDIEYIKAPTLKYFNALVDNPGYELAEIWILPEGGDPTSKNEEDWKVYKGASAIEKLHFTNREVTGQKEDYELIQQGTVIRLVYDVTSGTRNSPATFYDYDISDGVLTSGGSKYMNTSENGINANSNCNASIKYAFGNSNAGTKFGTNQLSTGANLNNSRLNMSNWSTNPEGSYGYAGCTFGLVSGATGSDVNFNVSAPKVFGSETQNGKTIYSGNEEDKFSLDFNRKGDTYTLSAVRGTDTNNLETFAHPGGYSHIASNNFWPMDSVDGKDGKTGGSDKIYHNGTTSAFPPSDDGIAHNNYFGMYYAIEFDLDSAYTGPLEYLFFGDDDMWVFLDDTTLVCDIGGVHSSVGEYVDLWDYLKNEDGSINAGRHTLKFFYTERGASGSSCWMQFTLPSVSSMTPETSTKDYGRLKIAKKVEVNKDGFEGFDCDADEFTFRIELEGAKDDYSYTKYKLDNPNPIESGLVLWDGATFTLKNDEYIIVDYLPIDTKYKITESNTAKTDTGNSECEYYTDISVNGKVTARDLIDEKIAISAIKADEIDEVVYTNRYCVYELPKTGGFGILIYTMAGALCILLCAGFMYTKRARERRR